MRDRDEHEQGGSGFSRRAFLKGSAAAATATAMATQEPQETQAAATKANVFAAAAQNVRLNVNGKNYTVKVEPRVTLLPTHGTHWMHVQDVGHIYHRRWEQTYESSVFHWQAVPRYGRLAYEAQVPKGTKLHFAVRAATKPQELELMPWRDVTSKRFKLSPIDRCLQYRAIFKSDNGDRYPVLDRVRVSVATDPVRKQESG